MMLTLLLLCWCCFPGKALQYHTGVQTPEWKPRLVWSCLGLYIVFLTALEFKQELWGLVIVAAGFAPAGASRGVECGLDVAAGVYGDVYRRPFTDPASSVARRVG